MQINFLPALEERPIDGSRPRPLIFVHIDTPRGSVPPTNEAVAESFAQHDAMLTMLEERGEKIFSILVHVHSLQGISPSSRYLEALCEFLGEHPFAVAPRTPQRPLMLTVSVPEEEEEEEEAVVDRSHPFFTEATSRICRAFWQNAHVRSSQFVFVDVVTAPDSSLVDWLVHGRSSNENPLVTVRVCDNPDDPPMGPDVLEVRLAGANVVAAGEGHVAATAHSVLAARPMAVPVVGFCVYSPKVADAVATSLLRRRDSGGNNTNNFICARFAAGVNHSSLGMAVSRGNGPGGAAALDGTVLMAAAWQCPSVASVCFDRFRFTSRTVAAVEATLQRAATGELRSAPITIVQCRGCTFSDEEGGDRAGTASPIGAAAAATGLCDLARAISRSGRLHVLEISDATLGLSDAIALVGMLVDPECTIDSLKVGSAMIIMSDDPWLDDGFVNHFFQNLPRMKSLVNLSFGCAVTAETAETVLDGVKSNYTLRKLEGLTFESELRGPESSLGAEEIESYLAANVRGRDVVARAVADPASRELQDKAIATILLLADMDDTTSLYLCLQLFLPSL